jgi:hypothetical protein
MSVVPPLHGIPLYRYIPGVGRVAAVQCGTSLTPVYGSFLSSTTQLTSPSNTSIAITYSERTIGTIGVNGSYPSSEIVIPTAGVYRILFSAQCDVAVGGAISTLDIFPVVNGTSVPKSNTRIRLSASAESCLVVEYIISFNANDTLQLYMRGTTVDARLLAIASGSGTPALPATPSIILNLTRIE